MGNVGVTGRQHRAITGPVAIAVICFIACYIAALASADEIFRFADGQAVLFLPKGVAARSAGPGKNADFELLAISDSRGELLRVYAGNAPQGVAYSGSKVEEAIDGYAAVTYQWSDRGVYFRLTLVRVKDTGWPELIQFYYHDVPSAQRGEADAIISSFRFTGSTQ